MKLNYRHAKLTKIARGIWLKQTWRIQGGGNHCNRKRNAFIAAMADCHSFCLCVHVAVHVQVISPPPSSLSLSSSTANPHRLLLLLQQQGLFITDQNVFWLHPGIIAFVAARNPAKSLSYREVSIRWILPRLQISSQSCLVSSVLLSSTFGGEKKEKEGESFSYNCLILEQVIVKERVKQEERKHFSPFSFLCARCFVVVLPKAHRGTFWRKIH